MSGTLAIIPLMLDQHGRRMKKMSEEQIKPPTQGVVVGGFKADVYASDDKKIDWMSLIKSPKFQWFAAEQSENSSANPMTWITEYVRQQIAEKSEQVFFNDYSAWHSNKGYWQNEDVYGNLLGED